MAVPYDFFRTPQPKNKDKVRYHARVVVRDTMETEDIARMIASRSTIKEGDVTGTLVELAKVLFTELPEGRSIHIDGIGSLTVSSYHERDSCREHTVQRHCFHTGKEADAENGSGEF